MRNCVPRQLEGSEQPPPFGESQGWTSVPENMTGKSMNDVHYTECFNTNGDTQAGLLGQIGGTGYHGVFYFYTGVPCYFLCEFSTLNATFHDALNTTLLCTVVVYRKCNLLHLGVIVSG